MTRQEWEEMFQSIKTIEWYMTMKKHGNVTKRAVIHEIEMLKEKIQSEIGQQE